MINSQIAGIEDPQLVERGEKIRIGDTVDVGVRIKEGEKERIQVFSGTVIRIKGDGVRKTFTVRRIVQGEGVERIFPFHSPKIDSVKVKRRGDVRRAKLYYLRDRVGKGTRVKEKIWAKEDEEKRAAKKAGKRRGKKGAETAAPETETATATATATNESAEAKE